MSSGSSSLLRLSTRFAALIGLSLTTAAFAQEPAPEQWRRVCPGKKPQTWYYEDAQGNPAGVWQSETPFILHEVRGKWALGTRAFDEKRAWINTENVCHLDNRRRVCVASSAILFWANDFNESSGRELQEGTVVSVLASSGEWARIEHGGSQFWMMNGFLCPIDPNVSVPEHQDDGGRNNAVEPIPALGGQQTCGTPQAAFLSTIAYAEGTNDRYNIIFGYQTFSSFAGHPRRKVCSGRLCSTAAGRYQILARTWDNVIQPSLSLPDFSPNSQDRAGVFLVRNRGVRNSDDRLDYGTFSRAIYKLNREWASLPGSPYGQPTRSMDSLWSKYRDRLTCN